MPIEGNFHYIFVAPNFTIKKGVKCQKNSSNQHKNNMFEVAKTNSYLPLIETKILKNIINKI